MIHTEIPIGFIFQKYRKFWWLLVITFVVGAGIGYLLPESLRSEVTVAKFSLPVVVREQPVTQWKEEDTYALMGFTKAWLDHTWETLAQGAFPDAAAYCVLQKDTYTFAVERQGGLLDTVTMNQIAQALTASFQDAFFTEGGSDLLLSSVQNTACLSDAAKSGMVECIPFTETATSSLETASFGLAEFLWVGDASAVTIEEKMPYNRYIQAFAGGVCAEMALLFVFLLDLTRRSARGVMNG